MEVSLNVTIEEILVMAQIIASLAPGRIRSNDPATQQTADLVAEKCRFVVSMKNPGQPVRVNVTLS